MTPFVESFATQQLLPPWTAPGARTWGFVFELQEAHIAAHLGKYFNGQDPASGVYAPMPGSRQYGLLMVSNCPAPAEERAAKARDTWAGISHTDVFLSFPTLRRSVGRDGMIIEDPELVWIQPLMCSNSATVVFSAREVWGSDMTYAAISAIPVDADPFEVHIDTAYEGVKAFSPREKARKLAGLHVQAYGKRGDDDIEALFREHEGLRAFYVSLARSGLVHNGAVKSVEETAIGFDLHNLKQVRDVFITDSALYRAIVATRSLYTSMDEFHFLDEAKVDIAFMWSPVMQDFFNDILGVPKAPGNGPPTIHRGDANPSARPNGASDSAGGRADSIDDVQDADWTGGRVEITPVLAFTFTSDIEFSVTGTIYTDPKSYLATR
jgi:hypothetical protein